MTQLFDTEKLQVSSLRNLFDDNAAVGGRLTKSSTVSLTQAQEIFSNKILLSQPTSLDSPCVHNR